MSTLKPTIVAEVIRRGQKIVLPEGPPPMPIPAAIEILQRKHKYEQEDVNIVEVIDLFPWDGAVQALKAMEEIFGVVFAEQQMSFFGPRPPQEIVVPISATETVNVKWGTFTLPNYPGTITFGQATKEGHAVFTMATTVKREGADVFKAIVELTKKKGQTESIYRGKAIKIQFTDDDGDYIPAPMPTFMDLSGQDVAFFSKRLADKIETVLFTPIERVADTVRHGIKRRSGVLLVGPPGTGKTLISHIVAKRAVKAGRGFIYCSKIDDFKHVMNFAATYGDPVVFVEDYDRLMSGDRTKDTDVILNLTDGIESKGSGIFTIATTNNVDAIIGAMMRPGRTDCMIRFSYPDAEATEKLIRHYAKDVNGESMIDEAEDISKAAAILAGNSPAVIEEAVRFSKLAAIKLSPVGASELRITAAAILEAAEDMKEQIALIDRKPKPAASDLERFGSALGNKVAKAMQVALAFQRAEDGERFNDLLDASEEEAA